MFVASDVTAFIEHTRDAVELGQDEVVVISADSYTITDFDQNPRPGKPFHINWDLAAAEKGGYDYFMLKEIAEQPRALADTLLGHLENGRIVLDEQRLSDDDLRTGLVSPRDHGEGPGPSVTLEAINGQRATVRVDGTSHEVDFAIPGVHNLLNACAALGVVLEVLGEDAGR